MKDKKRRCKFCRRWYLPDPRTYRRQIACSIPDCRNARRRQANKRWQLQRPGYQHYRRAKVRDWAGNYPQYWRRYRANHPDYVHRDNLRRVLSRKKSRLSAKQDAIRQISVEKLKSIQEIRPPLSAKGDAIDRRVDGLINYLFWKEQSAKQDAISPIPRL